MDRTNLTTHTRATRAAHWLNVLIVAFLMWSGFSMFAGDRHFAAFARMLPAAFWHALRFAGTKRELFTWHVFAGAFFSINGALYVASLLVTGAWRRIVPKGSRWLHDAARPLDYSILQRLAYTGVLGGAALMTVTGAALWFKHQVPWLLSAMGGERIVLPVHVIVATALIVFALVHVAQVLGGGLPTLRSMTVGGGMSKSAVPVRLRIENTR